MSGKYPKRWISGRSLVLYQKGTKKKVFIQKWVAAREWKTFQVPVVTHLSSLGLPCRRGWATPSPCSGGGRGVRSGGLRAGL